MKLNFLFVLFNLCANLYILCKIVFWYSFDLFFRFLDFGLLCRMEKKHQFAMLASILHIVNGDWGALVYDLAEMDVVRPGTNLRRVTMVL